MEIISYGNKVTENFDLYGIIEKGCPWRFLTPIAKRKFDILLNGEKVADFKIPPGNRFEWLKGDLKGFASIRINDQWRIIFRINKDNQLEDVEIVDYHK